LKAILEIISFMLANSVHVQSHTKTAHFCIR